MTIPTAYSLLVVSKNGQTVKLPFVSDEAHDSACYQLRREGFDVDDSPCKFTLHSTAADAVAMARMWCGD